MTKRERKYHNRKKRRYGFQSFTTSSYSFKMDDLNGTFAMLIPKFK